MHKICAEFKIKFYLIENIYTREILIYIEMLLEICRYFFCISDRGNTFENVFQFPGIH